MIRHRSDQQYKEVNVWNEKRRVGTPKRDAACIGAGPNRRLDQTSQQVGLEDRVTLALEHITRLYALMFLDLDNFKMVNDTQGHLKGDAMIQKIAAVFKRETRHENIVGRIGGDEFIIFLPSVRSEQDVTAYAQRLCDSIQNLEYFQTLNIAVSVSIGIIVSSQRGEDYASLVERADAKVYEAKAKGKNCYAI